MSILLKSAKIVDVKSKFNGKTQDILIDKGKIRVAEKTKNKWKVNEWIKKVLRNSHENH